MKDKPIKKWIIRLSISALVFLAAFPLVWLLALSFKTEKQVTSIPPVWFHMPYFGNYVQIFTEGDFLRIYYNSFIVATIATAVSLILGAVAGYAFSRRKYEFSTSRSTLFGILVLRMFPPVSTIIPIFLVVRMFQMIDTYSALAIVYAGLGMPLVIWIMKDFFANVPEAIEEAALIDGCSHARMFFRVVLPLTLPGLLTCGILSFIFFWNEFLFAMILTGSKVRTIPVLLSTFSEDHIVIWGQMAAVGTLAVTPIIVFGIFLRRYLVRGLAFGAVKG
jgi:multiple sugar transport system permease protein